MTDGLIWMTTKKVDIEAPFWEDLNTKNSTCNTTCGKQKLSTNSSKKDVEEESVKV